MCSDANIIHIIIYFLYQESLKTERQYCVTISLLDAGEGGLQAGSRVGLGLVQYMRGMVISGQICAHTVTAAVLLPMWRSPLPSYSHYYLGVVSGIPPLAVL